MSVMVLTYLNLNSFKLLILIKTKKNKVSVCRNIENGHYKETFISVSQNSDVHLIKADTTTGLHSPLPSELF